VGDHTIGLQRQPDTRHEQSDSGFRQTDEETNVIVDALNPHRLPSRHPHASALEVHDTLVLEEPAVPPSAPSIQDASPQVPPLAMHLETAAPPLAIPESSSSSEGESSADGFLAPMESSEHDLDEPLHEDFGCHFCDENFATHHALEQHESGCTWKDSSKRKHTVRSTFLQSFVLSICPQPSPMEFDAYASTRDAHGAINVPDELAVPVPSMQEASPQVPPPAMHLETAAPPLAIPESSSSSEGEARAVVFLAAPMESSEHGPDERLHEDLANLDALEQHVSTSTSSKGKHTVRSNFLHPFVLSICRLDS
jgi:hypothetical protein